MWQHVLATFSLVVLIICILKQTARDIDKQLEKDGILLTRVKKRKDRDQDVLGKQLTYKKVIKILKNVEGWEIVKTTGRNSFLLIHLIYDINIGGSVVHQGYRRENLYYLKISGTNGKELYYRKNWKEEKTIIYKVLDIGRKILRKKDGIERENVPIVKARSS